MSIGQTRGARAWLRAGLWVCLGACGAKQSLAASSPPHGSGEMASAMPSGAPAEQETIAKPAAVGGSGAHTMTSTAPAQASGGSAASVPAADGGSVDPPAGGAGGSASADAGAAGADMPAAGSGGAPSVDPDADIPPAASFPRLEASMFEKPQTISTAFDLAESPVWDFCQQKILFVDVNHRKIHSYESGGTIGVYVDMDNWVNGMMFEPDGHMLLAEMGGGAGGRITRMGRDLKTEVVIDHNTIGGALQTSDDLCRRSDGAIYFTDPVVSHGPYVNAAGALIARAFYLLKPPAADGGERQLVNLGSLSVPNGIRLSRDEKTLYVVEMGGNRLISYDVMPDGTIGPGKTFATMDSPDSFCMDAAGNFYVGIKTGLQVLRADGSKVTVIPLTSSSGTTNCGFGGPDGKTMWITAWTTFGQVDNMPIPGIDWYRNRNIPCQ